MLKLLPTDILLFENTGTSFWQRLWRKLIGPYSHVAMFLGTNISNGVKIHFIYESEEQGVVIESLSQFRGRVVHVLRPNLPSDIKQDVVHRAVALASDENIFYDYTSLYTSCVCRWLADHLGWNIPLRYKRDKRMICSEAVAEVFWQEGIPILDTDVIPFPADFLYSGLVIYKGRYNIDKTLMPLR